MAKYNYDLEERTATFGENIIELCRGIKENAITHRMISQIAAAGTSIGANYREANGASSSKDFRNKITICKKEANETKFWLRILLKYDVNLKNTIDPLLQESHEFTLIFQKIIFTLDNKKDKNQMI